MHDLACVVHLHSTYSDGTGTVPEIARAARHAKADVVLLTDHDNLRAKDNGEEGWYGPVLLLVGEEVSPKGGNHYLAFGLDEHVRHRGRSAAEICEAVRDGGGFGFAAHPWSKGSERFKSRARGMPFRDLNCQALGGVELWSFATDTGESLRSIPEMIRFIARPGHVLRHPPERNLRGWDELCRERPTTALGGLDAHQFGKRIGPVVPLRLMSYRRSFRYIRTHVLTEEPLSGELEHDRSQVFDALRGGRCYIAVDAIAPAKGFRFWAEGDGDRVEMGGEAPAGGWTLRVELPEEAELRVLRDGEQIGSGPEQRAEEAGVYRVEAHRDDRTWVISNPIYLRA
ncbi:MAG: hypothetical protein ACJ766_18180 [Thermoleophilaceae bacterium]